VENGRKKSELEEVPGLALINEFESERCAESNAESVAESGATFAL